MKTLLSCFSLLCFVSSLFAQVPDNSFGRNGKTVSRENFRPNVNVRGGYVQPNGRLLIGGDEFEEAGNGSSHICAFTPGGAVDTTFGKRGVAQLFGYGGGYIAKQSDNKIIAAGIGIEGDFITYIIVQRLTADGQYDFSFGKNSKTITDHNVGVINLTFVHSLAVDANDNIYVGGSFNSTSPIYDPEHNKHFTMLKYKSNGDIDSSFYIMQHNPFEQDCQEINVLTDGSVIASYLYHGLNYISACLIKYHPNGSIDKSFGENGFVFFGNKGYNDDGYVKLHTKLLPDGSLLSVTTDQNTTLVLYKVLPDGKPDNSFGKKGILKTGERNYESDNSFDVEPCGKILLPVAPRSIKRFLPDGSVDMSFGKNGTVDVAGSNQYGLNCEKAISQPSGFFALGSVTDFFDNGKYAASKFIYTLPLADAAVKQAPLPALPDVRVSLYPNPAYQFLQVSNISSLPSQLRITDMNGKTMMVVTANNNTQSVDISQLANGTYFLQTGKANAIPFIKQ